MPKQTLKHTQLKTSSQWIILFRDHFWWKALLIFVAVSALYTWFLNGNTFADPDSFYHIGMAEYLRDHLSIPHTFPWLSQTTLAEHYTDHHFLYHVLLIPFITYLSPFIGAKLLTILLAGIYIAAIYMLLARAYVRVPLFWVFALMTCSGLLFRLGLVKAPAVSLLFLLAGFWLLRNPHKRGRILALVPLSFFFVWSYGGFIVLLLLACCIAIGWLVYGIMTIREQKAWKRLFLEQSFAVISVGVGMIFGLLIHPSFPDHLFLLWQQIVDIGIINQKAVISVGREWYPPNLGFIIRDQWVLVILWIIAIFGGLRFWKRLHPETIGLFLFSLILIAFTFKSQRYVEYAVPWTLFATAFIYRDAEIFEHTIQWVRRLITHKPRTILKSPELLATICMTLFLSIVSCAAILFTLTSGIQRTHRDLHSGIAYTRSAAVNSWLVQHTAPNSVVYTSDWDVFPELFFYNRSNYYIVGLDPTFMYKFSAFKYWTWFNINTGKQTTHISDSITELFNSTTILVENDNTTLQKNLAADPTISLDYQDQYYSVYSIHDGSSETTSTESSPATELDETAQE